MHRGRLEQAATTGVIPHLLFIVRSQDPLKQFALPILCDLAHGGQVCRDRLWTCDGLGFYFGLLGDGTNEYWQLNAMEAILAWYGDGER